MRGYVEVLLYCGVVALRRCQVDLFCWDSLGVNFMGGHGMVTEACATKFGAAQGSDDRGLVHHMYWQQLIQ